MLGPWGVGQEPPWPFHLPNTSVHSLLFGITASSLASLPPLLPFLPAQSAPHGPEEPTFKKGKPDRATLLPKPWKGFPWALRESYPNLLSLPIRPFYQILPQIH